ncbi:hypothetical protein HDU96_004235 [Phlyctochytrium bullatum]|nr:hypothetical protein HDU96_004235 [Phlyctochytrium bullatum]
MDDILGTWDSMAGSSAAASSSTLEGNSRAPPATRGFETEKPPASPLSPRGGPVYTTPNTTAKVYRLGSDSPSQSPNTGSALGLIDRNSGSGSRSNFLFGDDEDVSMTPQEIRRLMRASDATSAGTRQSVGSGVSSASSSGAAAPNRRGSGSGTNHLPSYTGDIRPGSPRSRSPAPGFAPSQSAAAQQQFLPSPRASPVHSRSSSPRPTGRATSPATFASTLGAQDASTPKTKASLIASKMINTGKVDLDAPVGPAIPSQRLNRKERAKKKQEEEAKKARRLARGDDASSTGSSVSDPDLDDDGHARAHDDSDDDNIALGIVAAARSVPEPHDDVPLAHLPPTSTIPTPHALALGRIPAGPPAPASRAGSARGSFTGLPLVAHPPPLLAANGRSVSATNLAGMLAPSPPGLAAPPPPPQLRRSGSSQTLGLKPHGSPSRPPSTTPGGGPPSRSQSPAPGARPRSGLHATPPSDSSGGSSSSASSGPHAGAGTPPPPTPPSLLAGTRARSSSTSLASGPPPPPPGVSPIPGMQRQASFSSLQALQQQQQQQQQLLLQQQQMGLGVMGGLPGMPPGGLSPEQQQQYMMAYLTQAAAVTQQQQQQQQQQQMMAMLAAVAAANSIGGAGPAGEKKKKKKKKETGAEADAETGEKKAGRKKKSAKEVAVEE